MFYSNLFTGRNAAIKREQKELAHFAEREQYRCLRLQIYGFFFNLASLLHKKYTILCSTV
jgi:hypothetical protein